MLTKVFNVAILISMAAFFSTCTPRFDCANTTYNFEIGVKAYPDEDSIHVGDTIWFEINESTALKDMIRNGVRSTGAGGRFPNGWVTYTLPNGNAASFEIDGTFIGFRGIK